MAAVHPHVPEPEEEPLLPKQGEQELRLLQKQPHTSHGWPAVAIAVAVWYAAHTCSVLAASAILRAKPELNLAVTAVQVLSGLALGVTVASEGESQPPMPWRGVVAAGLLYYVGTAATNASMAILGSTETQAIKATEPLYTAALQWCLLSRRTSPVAVLALAIVSTGTALTAATGASRGAWRLGPSVVACVAFPLMRVVTKGEGMPTGARLLAVLSATAAGPACLGAWLGPMTRAPAGLTAATAAAYAVYQLASLWVLGRLEPTTHAVCNSLKRGLVVLGCAVADPSVPLGLERGAGLALVALGGVLYPCGAWR